MLIETQSAIIVTPRYLVLTLAHTLYQIPFFPISSQDLLAQV